MRIFIVLLLVVLVLLAGLPLVAADVEMTPCPACAGDDMATAWGICLAFLTAALALVLPALRQRVFPGHSAVPVLLLARLPHRPPRPR